MKDLDSSSAFGLPQNNDMYVILRRSRRIWSVDSSAPSVPQNDGGGGIVPRNSREYIWRLPES